MKVNEEIRMINRKKIVGEINVADLASRGESIG